jgi:zinc transport system permease protein
MLEMLTMPFLQRAFIAGIIIATLGSLLGVFVVQRKMSFLGDGLSHAAFGGVALGMLFSLEPLYVALPFTLLVSLAITWLKDKTDIENDTSIGIFFSVSVALGIVFLSLKKDYSADAYSYLFGSILSVSVADLWTSAAALLGSLILTIKYWKSWAYASFDAELAASDGVKVRKDDYALSVILSVVIVLAIKIVGIVLIAAFLVIPPASAKMLSKSFRQMSLLSIAFGICGATIGLLASVALDLPSGALIILAQAALFCLAVIVAKRSKI